MTPTALERDTNPSAAPSAGPAGRAREVPGPYPFRRFVLLCPQRSGSNALTSILAQRERVRLYGQLFNNGLEYKRYIRHDIGLPLFRAHPRSLLHFGIRPPARKWAEHQALRLVQRERDLARYVTHFWERYGRLEPSRPPAAAVGFKLHDYQITDRDMDELFSRHLDRIIILHRKNLLRAAVSWATAMQTGEWVRKDQPGSGPAATKPARRSRLDPRTLRWFIDKTRRNVADWIARAERSGTPFLELTYEDHVVPRRLGPLFDLLGLDPLPASELEIRTKKLASNKYEHVSNAAEIDERLGTDETGYLLRDA